jgi:hypothetical protein
VLVSSGDDGLLVTGDLLVHAIQLLYPELAYSHEMDAAGARVSRERLAAQGHTLASSHLGEPFTAPFTEHGS